MTRRFDDTLELALEARLREVVTSAPATESQLRLLQEEGDGWARALAGQIDASERRVRTLDADPASSLAEIAAELRRLVRLYRERHRVEELLERLDERSRQLRTLWLRRARRSAPQARGHGR